MNNVVVVEADVVVRSVEVVVVFVHWTVASKVVVAVGVATFEAFVDDEVVVVVVMSLLSSVL